MHVFEVGEVVFHRYFGVGCIYMRSRVLTFTFDIAYEYEVCFEPFIDSDVEPKDPFQSLPFHVNKIAGSDLTPIHKMRR